MDPNQNLQEQMELITEAIDLDPTEVQCDLNDEARAVFDQHIRLCGLVEALNEWIRRGGFLPEVWQQQQDELSDKYFRETLEERFPWLGTDEPADGAEVVDQIQALYGEIVLGQHHRPRTPEPAAVLSQLERVEGSVTITEGVCHFPDGSALPLRWSHDPASPDRKGRGGDIVAGIILLLAFLAFSAIRA